MDAKDVNIQNRTRVFIVAFLNIEDCDRFVFPESVSLEVAIEDILEYSVKQGNIYYHGLSS